MAGRSRGTNSKRNEETGFEAWGGYMNAKIQKLENQVSLETAEKGVKTNIFKGIAVFVNGYTQPPSDEIKRLMQENGGVYHHYYSRRKVTHIILSNLAQSKINNLTDQKVVKPEWITERTLNQPGLSGAVVTTKRPSVSSPQATAATSEDSSNIDAHADDRADKLSRTGASAVSHGGRGSRILQATDSNFLSEFYSNSRLHHLSTWGAELRQYVQQLLSAAGPEPRFPGRERLRAMAEARGTPPPPCGRVIMHIDMDCFFVSVGLRARPDLVGQPVAVTHSRAGAAPKSRQGVDVNYEREYYRGKRKRRDPADADINAEEEGVAAGQEGEAQLADLQHSEVSEPESMSEIASCSYEARAAGVKNGMFMGRARQLCPTLQTIPYDFKGYREVSEQLYDTVARYTLDIEAVSCDELLVDLTQALKNTGVGALDIAGVMREEVFQRTGCRASTGIGPNILLAKLATRTAKPNGQFEVTSSDASEFVKDKAVRDLPGVGWSMTRKLQNLSVETCGELQGVKLDILQKEFGPKIGETLYKQARGQDERPLQLTRDRKSVSAEVNYGIRFTKEEEVDKFMLELSEEVHNRLIALNLKGKTVTLKLKIRKKDAPTETAKYLGHGVCDNVTKSVTLPMATDDTAVIATEVRGILRGLHVAPTDHRGVGIQMSKLEAPVGVQQETRGVQSILKFATRGRMTSTPVKPQESGRESGLADTRNTRPDSKLDNQDTRVMHQPAAEEPAAEIVPAVRSTPPLPSLHQYGCQPSPIVRASPKNAGGLCLPSPSQIDPTVLEALPDDVKRYVLEHMKKRQVVISPAAGCSHWPSPAESEPIAGEKEGPPAGEKEGPPAGEDEGPHQSFLDALPEELRAEVLRDYEAMRGNDRPRSSNQSPAKTEKTEAAKPVHPLMKLLRSPRGKDSPKAARGRGKERGRGRGKKLLFPPKAATPQKKVIIVPPPRPTGPVHRMPERLTFCGTSDHRHIRRLLQDWVHGGDERSYSPTQRSKYNCAQSP